MALHLVKRKGSDFWYIRGTFHGHKISGQSTQTRDRSVAQARLREVESGIISERPAAKRDPDAWAFRRAADLYLDHHKRSETDRRAILRLCEIEIAPGELLGDKPLDQIKPHMVATAALKAYPNGSAATRNRMAIMNASAVLHYAAEQDLCPYVKVRRFEEAPVAPRDVSLDVARTLIGSADTERQALLLLMMFRQGWRITELLRIEWAHLDLEGGTVHKFNSKAASHDLIGLHDDVLAVLRAIPEGQRTGTLFPWSDRWAVYDWLWPLRDRLGVHFTPHMARHTFATQLVLAGGAGEFDLLATRNWKDLKSVKRYTRLATEHGRSVINRLKG